MEASTLKFPNTLKVNEVFLSDYVAVNDMTGVNPTGAKMTSIGVIRRHDGRFSPKV